MSSACVFHVVSACISVLAVDQGLIVSNHNEYNFSFQKLPHCQCEDWSNTMMPCKHFLVVMQHFKNWNWKSFPEKYRNSPFLTLDPIADENPTEKQSMESREENTNFADQDQPDSGKNLSTDPSGGQADSSAERPVSSASRTDASVGRSDTSSDEQRIIPANIVYEVLFKKPGSKSIASECRDRLDEINNLTYMIQDKAILTSLYNSLQETLEKLKQSVVDDEGQARKSEGKGGNTCTIKGRKRLGQWNEDFNERKLLRTMNGSGDSSGDASGNIATYRNVTDLSGCQGINRGIAGPGGMDVRIPGSSSDMNGDTGPSHDRNGDVTVSDNSLQLNGSQSNESSSLNFLELGDKNDGAVLYSSPGGCLSKYDEKRLTKQEEITPSAMNLSQDILKEAFPNVKGFKTVVRGSLQVSGRVSGDFVQILHDGNNHWVCVSNIGLDVRDPAAVNMYDSMNQGFIAKFIKQRLASFMCIQSAEMKVIMKSVQQQTSNVDCGVFAIAFATALAFGQDPSKLRFDVPKMRSHLVECLKLKKMSPFPEMKPGCSDIVLSKRKFYTIELFCSCRMPYEKPKSEADLMAKCGSCKEWFHQRCDSLKSSGNVSLCVNCVLEKCHPN